MLPLEEIRTETEALRRLARALVADEATAADLVQDTWLTAIAQPPDLDRPVRPWLVRVLYNRAISKRRAADRADARTAAMAATASADGADPESSHASRQLLDEVAALPEADQALLHARFWEGCNATECAARLGRPASTIRTQLSRALARLRRRLDERAGDRRAWVAGLVPLLGAPGQPAVGGGGSLRAIGLALGAGAAATMLFMLAPNGCGAAVVDSAPQAEPEAAILATRSDAAPQSSAPRAASGREPAREGASSPSVSSPRKLEHPKLSVHFAMQHVDELLEECRTGKGDAMLRFRQVIVFGDDGPPFVESVDVPYHENFSSDELECVQQTLLSLDIPPAELDPSMAKPWRFEPTTELFFDEGGAMLRQSVARGPLLRLVTRTEDGSDLRDAVAACSPSRAGSYRATLTFDPLTGGLSKVQPDPTADAATQKCVEKAVRHAIIKGMAFEPRAPEDASITCTFALGTDPAAHACTRLGPGGTYVDAPREVTAG